MSGADCGVLSDHDEKEPVPSLAVGVVVERRALDNPWIDHKWQAVGVVPGVVDLAPWTEIRSGDGWVQYHAGHAKIELYQRETEGYRANLSSPPPSVYVVLNGDEDAKGPHGVDLFLVTVCPYEAESYVESGDEIVDAVTMPPEILSWVQAYIDKHHVDQPFKKRKRKSYDPRKTGGMDGDQPPPVLRDKKPMDQ